MPPGEKGEKSAFQHDNASARTPQARFDGTDNISTIEAALAPCTDVELLAELRRRVGNYGMEVTVCVLARHSRTSRVPGLRDESGVMTMLPLTSSSFVNAASFRWVALLNPP